MKSRSTTVEIVLFMLLVSLLGALLYTGVGAMQFPPPVPPTLTIDKTPAQLIQVRAIPPTVDEVCVVFTSLDETLNGEPYAPRHCVLFDEPTSSYRDDWDFIPEGHTYDVQAEAYEEGSTTPLKSNTVRVTH